MNNLDKNKMNPKYFQCSVCNISLPIIYKGQDPPFLPGVQYVIERLVTWSFKEVLYVMEEQSNDTMPVPIGGICTECGKPCCLQPSCSVVNASDRYVRKQSSCLVTDIVFIILQSERLVISMDHASVWLFTKHWSLGSSGLCQRRAVDCSIGSATYTAYRCRWTWTLWLQRLRCTGWIESRGRTTCSVCHRFCSLRWGRSLGSWSGTSPSVGEWWVYKRHWCSIRNSAILIHYS